MAHGKHLRQFWCRDSLHERRRYRIEHAGRAVAFNNPFGMGNERIPDHGADKPVPAI